MSFIARPNSFVSKDEAASTQLTYALQVRPAPITVSVSEEDPVLASLEFVVTNPTDSALNVESVAFTIQVGTDASLTPTTAGITTAVSDTTNWIVNGPSGTVTSGPATYTLQPATGQYVSLAAGASVIVQIFDIQTNTIPGNSTVKIKEMTTAIALTSFLVTTFPAGFYFNGLAATVQNENGSSLVPVAQVNTGSTVTLTWNSSVVDLNAFTIYYSNATQGQQPTEPSEIGEWTSPPLSSDTVFTVAVTTSVEGGQRLTASMTTAVSVRNPSLVADDITINGQTTTTSLNVLTNLLIHSSPPPPSGTPLLEVGPYGDVTIDNPGVMGGRFIVKETTGYVGINTPIPANQLDVTGNTQVNGNIGVTGVSQLAGGLNVTTGPTTLGGTLAVSDAATLSAGLTVNGAATLATTTITGPVSVLSSPQSPVELHSTRFPVQWSGGYALQWPQSSNSNIAPYLGYYAKSGVITDGLIIANVQVAPAGPQTATIIGYINPSQLSTSIVLPYGSNGQFQFTTSFAPALSVAAQNIPTPPVPGHGNVFATITFPVPRNYYWAVLVVPSTNTFCTDFLTVYSVNITWMSMGTNP